MVDSLDYYRNQISLARNEIKNLRQQLTALKHEHTKEIKLIKSKLNELRCSNCENAATTVAQNHNHDTSDEDNGITYRPIGFIETSFQNKRGVPRQPSVLAQARGAISIDQGVFNNPQHALSGLEEFSHMWIMFHFHVTESTSVAAKVAPPRLEGERRGVFSTRSPHRPCPIGLSLVKIQSIEGNKIYFLGVDMVNGTPVLDIKPYIPQYDYPTQSYEAPMSSVERPPTEGTSDAVQSIATLQIDDDAASLSPRPSGIDTSPLSRSPFENNSQNLMTPISPSPESPSSEDLVDVATFRDTSPIRRPNTERGAPDGQERFTPPQSALINISHDGIRVAPWIANPPSQTYDVRFTEDTLQRLGDLIGDRAESFKSNIQSLLAEDPRSQYVRTRYPDHEYSCVLEDLCISCVFDANSAVCSIVAVRNADDLQQN